MMKFGRWGVFVFADMLDSGRLAELPGRVEQLGYSTLWYDEALRYETFALGGYLLGRSQKLIVASGIANIYGRDPTTAAFGHTTLNGLYGGRYVMGLGVSHESVVSGMRGHTYGKPVTTMRNYLDGIERAWEALGGWGGGAQIVLAALGPNMSRLAAERTLGAFPYNITPAHVAAARDAMGENGVIICEQKICLCGDAATARQVARGAVAMYLEMPNYLNNWRRLGFGDGDFADGGSDALLDAMVYWGSEAQIRARLEEYFAAGADQVVIQPLRPDGQPSPDWNALEAFAPDRG
jgi:probable F420-dependent oxidoreductase